MKKIYFTVTTDLSNDQRMLRICRSLAAGGYAVVLTGRRHRGSRPLQQELFEQKRLLCFFGQGKLFYLEFNLRLFFFLLFRKMDAICAIDLDTVLPCWMISTLRKKIRIYDGHEYFSEMKEVVTRRLVKKIWKGVERFALPRFPLGYTVSDSIALAWQEQYGIRYEVIRNVPMLLPASHVPVLPEIANLPDWVNSERWILYQGAVNEARGLESLIPAMRSVASRLVICGEGNLMKICRQMVRQYHLEEKVVFMGQIAPELLRIITPNAYIGINLVEPIGLNQYYSLANKFFDYIHAEVPQLSMDFPEYRRVNDHRQVALLIGDTNEKKIADALNNLLDNTVLYQMLKENCRLARLDYKWQEEEKKLLRFYQQRLS